MFIMSLAIADLTVGLIVMPISSAYAITGNNPTIVRTLFRYFLAKSTQLDEKLESNFAYEIFDHRLHTNYIPKVRL